MRLTSRDLRKALVLMAALGLSSCGTERDGSSSNSNDADAGAASPLAMQESTSQTSVCGVPAAATPASLGFNLLAGETYADSIVPIVTAKCARCHAGDAAMQNSTTCGFLEKNIDAVLVRMQNGLTGEPLYDVEEAKLDDDITKLSANDIRDQVSGGDRNKWPMPPLNQNNDRRLTQAEFDIFTAWKDVPDKCVGVSVPDTPLPGATHYSDEDEERSRLAKLFESDSCQDGPETAANRAFVEPLLALPADSASAFYDYEAREFVPGATKMDGNCTIDYFIAAVAPIPGAQAVLQEYKDYGWWTTQCAIVDGRPQAYLAHVATVTTALGDQTHGAFLKLLRITDQ